MPKGNEYNCRMKFDPKVHHRHSICLKGYDYSQAGAYFVTIVADGCEMLFGEIVNEEMILNRYGQIVLNAWIDLPNHYRHAELDAFVVMPNHVHGIFVLNEGSVVPDDSRGGLALRAGQIRPMKYLQANFHCQPPRPAPTRLPNRVMVCLKLSAPSNRFLRVGSTCYAIPKESPFGSAIITNTSSITNPKWTGFPVTLNPIHCGGQTMRKTQ